jgi:hypothetical protein
MTVLLGSRGRDRIAPLAPLALLALALVALAVWLGVRKPSVTRHNLFDDYPALFVEEGVCDRRDGFLESGRRREERARLRTDRYAYDPSDGIRAVRRYQEAESCYRAAGDERGVRRVHRAGRELAARVNTDYAAARLNLLNALERERWSVALTEIRRLLLLTDHVGRHEYVEWLREIIGRVSVKASSAP